MLERATGQQEVVGFWNILKILHLLWKLFSWGQRLEICNIIKLSRNISYITISLKLPERISCLS